MKNGDWEVLSQNARYEKAEPEPKDISKLNLHTYESPDIVDFYKLLQDLTPPEHTILNLFKTKLPQMNVLDIGVGGGRTTKHFAPLSGNYIGVDYSPKMIEACRKKFPKLRFEVADVKNLSLFEDACFDFTLFSNNGLDYMNHENRIQALNEIHRVTKHGYLCFSTHNLNNIPKQFKFNFQALSSGTFRQFKAKLKNEIYRICNLYSKNSHLLLNMRNNPYLLFNDDAHQFRLVTYYVKPKEQVRQLETLNYRNIRAFGADGREIAPTKLLAVKDFYLYFLAMN